MSPRALELAEELRKYLHGRFHIALRIRSVREGLNYRIYRVRRPKNRHLVDVRPVQEFPPTKRVRKVLVVTPPELIANKVVSMLARKKKRKGHMDAADLNNDGFQDLFVANVDHEMFSVYQNNKDETFQDVAQAQSVARATRLLSGWGLKYFDYDNDGEIDLFLANGHPDDMIDEYSMQVHYKEPLVLFHKGEVLSQTATRITTYPQLTVRLAQLDKHLGEHPNDSAALLERASLRMNQGQAKAALRDLRGVLALQDDPQAIGRSLQVLQT